MQELKEARAPSCGNGKWPPSAHSSRLGSCESHVLKETKLYFFKTILSFDSFATEFGCFLSFSEHKNSNGDNKSYSKLSFFFFYPHKT